MTSVTDIIEWLEYKNFPNKVFAETYMRENQKGNIYNQQQEALDQYYQEESQATLFENLRMGEQEHEPVEQYPEERFRYEETYEVGGVLDRLQRGEEEQEVRAELERPTEPTGEPEPETQAEVTPIPATEEERKTLARRLYNSIRKYLGGQ